MALESSSRRSEDAMQIASGYAAIDSIFEISSSQRACRLSARGAHGSCDTVSISEEARVAYRNSLQNADSGSALDARQEARLTRWFNQWHAGADFPVNENLQAERGAGSLLPENAALKASLEKEIDRLLGASGYAPGTTASPELLEKVRPLQQKLNAITSLGDMRVLDGETLETAAKFLQALEDAWNGAGSENASLTGQFRSAVASWKTQPQDGHALQEKLRALQEDAVEPAAGQESGAVARFRKQFAAYRGNGIFAENTGAAENASIATSAEDAPQAAEAEKMGKKASEIERKIKDLTAQLEAVMASGMPETEKDALSTRISKEIEELQSQLTAYKQVEKALAEA